MSIFFPQAFADMTPDLQPLLDGVKENRQQWQKLADESAIRTAPRSHNNNNNNNYSRNNDRKKVGTNGD